MAERVAVVTGAGGGIGRVLVDRLDGYNVIGLDLPRACPPDDPRYRPLDITDDAAVAELFSQIDRIDLLIHSAGLSAIGAFTDHDITVHRKVMDVTHFGAVSITQAALPALRRAGGRVVLIGSVTGFAPVLGRPPYVAAKHAVTALFTAIRPELEAQGVSVTIVHPTFVAGGMTEAGRAPGAQRKTTGEEITSEDVAAALLDGVEHGRDLVLVGRTAKLAWTVSRLAPSLYMRLMIRRMHKDEGGAA
ncbi:MAG: SDR family NAD(P)-dependent oxidoreductase [Candidatus Nanopelagicales bacterium]